MSSATIILGESNLPPIGHNFLYMSATTPIKGIVG
jgi:hypothetical protein